MIPYRAEHEPAAAEGPAVAVEHLSKRYTLRPAVSRRGALARLLRRDPIGDELIAGLDDELDDDVGPDDALDDEEPRPRPAAAGAPSEVWALRDVSLEIASGTSLGIVGASGSGKSTLLKVLSRLTPPTEGRVTIRGRVVPPFLSAQVFVRANVGVDENVRLLASVLGFSQNATAERIRRILDFAEVRHLPSPASPAASLVHRRLLCATVLHLDADVILADDVLAVGDPDYKERCLELVAGRCREGATLVYSSNDLETVGRLCSEALWLDAGQARLQGPVDAVMGAYAEESRHPSSRKAQVRIRARAARRSAAGDGGSAGHPPDEPFGRAHVL